MDSAEVVSDDDWFLDIFSKTPTVNNEPQDEEEDESAPTPPSLFGDTLPSSTVKLLPLPLTPPPISPSVIITDPVVPANEPQNEQCNLDFSALTPPSLLGNTSSSFPPISPLVIPDMVPVDDYGTLVKELDSTDKPLKASEKFVLEKSREQLQQPRLESADVKMKPRERKPVQEDFSSSEDEEEPVLQPKKKKKARNENKVYKKEFPVKYFKSKEHVKSSAMSHRFTFVNLERLKVIRDDRERDYKYNMENWRRKNKDSSVSVINMEHDLKYGYQIMIDTESAYVTVINHILQTDSVCEKYEKLSSSPQSIGEMHVFLEDNVYCSVKKRDKTCINHKLTKIKMDADDDEEEYGITPSPFSAGDKKNFMYRILANPEKMLEYFPE